MPTTITNEITQSGKILMILRPKERAKKIDITNAEHLLSEKEYTVGKIGNIELFFDLKAPYSESYLYNDGTLMIEISKRSSNYKSTQKLLKEIFMIINSITNLFKIQYCNSIEFYSQGNGDNQAVNSFINYQWPVKVVIEKNNCLTNKEVGIIMEPAVDFSKL